MSFLIICPVKGNHFLKHASCVYSSKYAISTDRWRPSLWRFSAAYSHSSFSKNIIENLTVLRKDKCQISCFIEISCKSYNVGPSTSENNKRVCELSSSTYIFHQNHLVPRPGFTLLPSVRGKFGNSLKK